MCPVPCALCPVPCALCLHTPQSPCTPVSLLHTRLASLQKLFKSQNAASLSFGAMVALSGFVGTAAGGVILDKMQVKDWTATVAKHRERHGEGMSCAPVCIRVRTRNQNHVVAVQT